MKYTEVVSTIVDHMLEAKEANKSAWDLLSPENRSEHEGWTKAGEFACTNCGVSIGKNLKGERPIASALEHYNLHRLPPPSEPTSTPKERGPHGKISNDSPFEYEHDFNTLRNRQEY